MRPDWSQIFGGAAGGAALTLLLQMLKTWFEHFLDQRKVLAKEALDIRSEQREQARRTQERRQAEAETRERDKSILLMYQTQLAACTEITRAAHVVTNLHDFFNRRHCYYQIEANRNFLEKYPKDFYERTRQLPRHGKIEAEALAALKADSASLRIE